MTGGRYEQNKKRSKERRYLFVINNSSPKFISLPTIILQKQVILFSTMSSDRLLNIHMDIGQQI
jgi:hypothetical protein